MSRIEVRQVSAESYTEFMAYVSHSRFHELSWLEVIAPVYGIEIIPIGFYSNNGLIAVSPMMRRRIGPFSLWGAPLRKCAVPAATPFCTPPSEAGRVLVALQEWVRQQKLGFLQITVPASVELQDITPDRIECLDNLELSLAPSLKSLWQQLSQLPRRGVKKALRAGVRIHWCLAPGILDDQILMLRETYGRQGAGTSPNHPEQLYEVLLLRKESTGIKVLCAKHQGRTIAALWVFEDAERSYYWDAVSLESARELSANHLLVWCLINWAHHRGFKVLDFVGTSVGGRGGSRPGIGRFKQSMGASPVNHNLCYWYSPWMGVVLRVYRLFQTVKTKVRRGAMHA